jgi:SAM-dependent methyltransferase
MLDLVRLSPRRLLPPGGEDLLRQIARLTDLQEGSEVLWVPCGTGAGLQFLVEEYGVNGSGVESDPGLLARGQEWGRKADVSHRFHLQAGKGDDLPYRDGIFDVVVGELGLTADADPAGAVREMERVTRPGGVVVLVQLVWKAPVDPARREILSGYLGVRPLMLVEWKRLLREVGLEDLHTEDWSDEDTAFRTRVRKPFPDFAELFSLSEKLGILRRAWAKWRWRGVVTALRRELQVHRLLTRDRILGLDLVRARKAGGAPVDVAPPASIGASPHMAEEAPEFELTPEPDPEPISGPGSSELTSPLGKQEAPGADEADEAPEDGPDVKGLPLFGGGAG